MPFDLSLADATKLSHMHIILHTAWPRRVIRLKLNEHKNINLRDAFNLYRFMYKPTMHRLLITINKIAESFA